MSPFRHPMTTVCLSAPPGWDRDEPCIGLWVNRTDGIFFSYWRPTWRERLWLLFGWHVRLAVVASGHPPVMIEVKS